MAFILFGQEKEVFRYALLDLFCIPDLDVPDTLFGFVYAGTLLDMSDQSGVSDNCFDFRTRTLFS